MEIKDRGYKVSKTVGIWTGNPFPIQKPSYRFLQCTIQGKIADPNGAKYKYKHLN